MKTLIKVYTVCLHLKDDRLIRVKSLPQNILTYLCQGLYTSAYISVSNLGYHKVDSICRVGCIHKPGTRGWGSGTENKEE